MRPAGGGSGALVVDLDNGRSVFARRAGTRRTPASVEKIYTTVDRAAEARRPTTDAATRRRRRRQLGDDGTWTATSTSLGGGDPTLRQPGLHAPQLRLAARTTSTWPAALTGAGIERSTAASSATTARGSQLPRRSGLGRCRAGGALRRTAGAAGWPTPTTAAGPAPYAATQLKVALKGRGRGQGGAGARSAPSGAAELATRRSPPIATLVRLTLQPSDNFFAEMLIKGLGAALRRPRLDRRRGDAWSARTMVATSASAPRVVDGSGLSRSDRTTPKRDRQAPARHARAEPESTRRCSPRCPSRGAAER